LPNARDPKNQHFTSLRILVSIFDYLEKASDASKYGEFSRAPYLEMKIPSILDPVLAPEGKHVASVYVQFAPYKLKNGNWET